MKYNTLDNIVRGFLMKKQYTMHRYLHCLKYATDCLRELALDDLQIINSKVLTLNSYKAVTIPDDCVDLIRVGVENGQYVRPMTAVDSFNRTYNYDNAGNPIPWPQVEEGLGGVAYFGVPYLTYFVNQYNSRGENTGGLYGFRTDGSPFIYQVMEERNEIQFDPALGFSKVVLDYVSDGRTSSAASRIPTYAEFTIEQFIDWQLDENTRTVPSTEKQRRYDHYVSARTGLRARKNPLTAADIMAIWRNNYNAAPKT